MFETDFYL